MDVILIPGLWLDGSSWNAVVPGLEAAGHRAHPLTLPGLESPDADRASVSLRDHVDAVVARIDELDGPVVLVAHSAGGAVAHAAVDARPHRVARVVYTASEPVADGECVNDELPSADGEIPMPDWSFWDADMLVDLDEDLRRTILDQAVPSPARAATDPQTLSDERRYDVPVTIVTCDYTEAMMRGWIAEGYPSAAEVGRIRSVEFVALPTGHWPQFSRPTDLARVINEAI
ncbi:alpha/beta fold hydrolase [Cryptosporangium arvum]|uniref:alpha/beta fold hydrolase n=1 Tax=Cryptosporangium arvum TaxID=80871 RepID=UPI0004B66198|nr:alpha/beta hydrolase [Cryptosporangium arvum]